MGRFNFGIGLSIDDSGVRAAFGSLSNEVSSIETAINNMGAQAPDMAGVRGAIDTIRTDLLTALSMPGANPFQDVEASIRSLDGTLGGVVAIMSDVSETLNKVHEDTQLLAGASGDAALGFDELRTSVSGIDESLRRATPTLESTDDRLRQLVDTLDRSPTGLQDSLDDVDRGATRAGRSRGWRAARRGISDVASGVRDFAAGLQQLMGPASLVEQATARLGAQMGETKAQSDAAWRSYLEVANAQRASVQTTADLALALGDVSNPINEMSASARSAALRMVNSFDVPADALAGMIGDAERLGVSFTALGDGAAHMGQQLRVSGLVGTLPETIQFADQVQSKFVNTMNRGSDRIIRDVVSVGATFQKVFRKTAPEAAAMARASFERFAGAIETNQDVFLGLSDDFDPLTTALLETGRGFQEVQHILAEGQESPIDFARRIHGIIDDMGASSLRAQRLLRQVMRNVDPATQALLRMTDAQLANSDAVEAATQAAEPPDIQLLREQNRLTAEQSALLKRQAGALDRVGEAMQQNVLDASARFQNMQDVANEIRQTFSNLGRIAGFEVLSAQLQTLNEFGLTVRAGMTKEEMDAITSAVKANTIAVEGSVAAINALGVLLEPLRALIAGVGGIATLSGVAAAGGPIATFSAALSALALVGGGTVLAMEGLIAAFEVTANREEERGHLLEMEADKLRARIAKDERTRESLAANRVDKGTIQEEVDFADLIARGQQHDQDARRSFLEGHAGADLTRAQQHLERDVGVDIQGVAGSAVTTVEDYRKALQDLNVLMFDSAGQLTAAGREVSAEDLDRRIRERTQSHARERFIAQTGYVQTERDRAEVGLTRAIQPTGDQRRDAQIAEDRARLERNIEFMDRFGATSMAEARHLQERSERIHAENMSELQALQAMFPNAIQWQDEQQPVTSASTVQAAAGQAPAAPAAQAPTLTLKSETTATVEATAAADALSRAVAAAMRRISFNISNTIRE